eukprot:TRINITY_DN35599_c0_g1_i1.p1 TRINITY_DN35599_c0_g1~~TRINITY_DN35599_c0_g1_i1.p1  ORF type:complete len:434 (+),score=60.17 TRINITY_DN35599_c0_g1_i1:58-1359(+)
MASLPTWRLLSTAALCISMLGGAASISCPSDEYDWICRIEQGPEYQTYDLPVAVLLIDRQYQLPRGTTLRGSGPGRTVIHAVGKPFTQGCGSFGKNRIGLLAGNDTVIRGFTFRGIDIARWSDGTTLCGGAAIETPGCADAFCEGPFDTGNGAAVSNVLVEDVDIALQDGKPTVQNNFWMAKTRVGACNNVTVRHMRSNGSWADGINVHGAHTNILIDNCDFRNSGDDVFAMWSAGDRMANVTFQNNYAANPTFPWHGQPVPSWGSNHVNCFAAYGGSGQLKWINNRCTPAPVGMLPPNKPHAWPDTGMIVFHSNFEGTFGSGTTAKIQGNSVTAKTVDGLPAIQDVRTLRQDPHPVYPVLLEPKDCSLNGTGETGLWASGHHAQAEGNLQEQRTLQGGWFVLMTALLATALVGLAVAVARSRNQGFRPLLSD